MADGISEVPFPETREDEEEPTALDRLETYERTKKQVEDFYRDSTAVSKWVKVEGWTIGRQRGGGGGAGGGGTVEAPAVSGGVEKEKVEGSVGSGGESGGGNDGASGGGESGSGGGGSGGGGNGGGSMENEGETATVGQSHDVKIDDGDDNSGEESETEAAAPADVTEDATASEEEGKEETEGEAGGESAGEENANANSSAEEVAVESGEEQEDEGEEVMLEMSELEIFQLITDGVRPFLLRDLSVIFVVGGPGCGKG